MQGMHTTTRQKVRSARRARGWIGFLLLALAIGFYVLLVRPWFLGWGATSHEKHSSLPGDELVLQADRQVTRAITIHAPPKEVWPWLIQLGADRGGFYSYTWLEGLIGCNLQNAEQIEPALQGLKVGDTVRMCPEGSGPPVAYTVARMDTNKALVLGVKEENRWLYTWSLVLDPVFDDGTRLVVRTRTAEEPGWQKAIELGVFVMERGMMLGIKQRTER